MSQTLDNEKSFSVGDFVRVIRNTHDERLPPSRMGHLVEQLIAEDYHTWSGKVVASKIPVWHVYMTNGVTLKFHEMFLEKIC